VSCGFFARASLKIAQHNHGSIVVWKRGQLRVEQVSEFLAGTDCCDAHGFKGSAGLCFAPLSSGVHLSRLERCLSGNSIEPVRQRSSRNDGRGFASEHKKGGLEGILGILSMPEYPLANLKHHRAVSTQNGFKGSHIELFDE
jgi:hypothetical protein